jgi:hypothetical protein
LNSRIIRMNKVIIEQDKPLFGRREEL